jgi:hypothetical protein
MRGGQRTELQRPRGSTEKPILASLSRRRPRMAAARQPPGANLAHMHANPSCKSPLAAGQSRGDGEVETPGADGSPMQMGTRNCQTARASGLGRRPAPAANSPASSIAFIAAGRSSGPVPIASSRGAEYRCPRSSDMSSRKPPVSSREAAFTICQVLRAPAGVLAQVGEISTQQGQTGTCHS